MWLDIYEEFSELSKSEKMALFNAMKEDLFPDETDKITELLKSIRESRFSSSMGIVGNLSMIWQTHLFQVLGT
jgi:ribosomal protein L29